MEDKTTGPRAQESLRVVDSILNEMLKHTDQRFKLAMLKLFNDVLCVGFFPEIWNKGLISPIHKSGDKLDPNNYRGICVNSNLGKVLCSILNTRLLHFLMKHNALSKCQIGFLPKCRTSDHIFTLQTLIDKYVHQNKEKSLLVSLISRSIRFNLA